MRFSIDRHKVVLTVGEERNVFLHQHFLVLVLVLEKFGLRFIFRI